VDKFQFAMPGVQERFPQSAPRPVSRRLRTRLTTSLLSGKTRSMSISKLQDRPKYKALRPLPKNRRIAARPFGVKRGEAQMHPGSTFVAVQGSAGCAAPADS
jgi:hypothetical protein